MAGEADQTRWVGVRPTDPPVTIPVSVVGGGGAVTTKKILPAISDMQAIECVVQFYEVFAATANTNYDKVTGNVPAGKLWVISFAIMYASQTRGNQQLLIMENATEKVLINFAKTPVAFTKLMLDGVAVLDEGQHITFRFLSMLTTDIMRYSCGGYQVSKYA